MNESCFEGIRYKNTVMITAIAYCLAAAGFLNITQFQRASEKDEEGVKGLNGYIGFDKIFYAATDC